MSFSYLNCALCRVPMVHHQIETQLTAHRELQHLAEAAAVQKFRDDGCIAELQGKLERPITDHEVSTRALADMAVFLCCDCQKPYCAGRMDCAAAAQEEDAEAEPTRCPSCEWNNKACVNDHRCMVHGHRFAMFKCDSCCAVATWNCYSNHYCERCHNRAADEKNYPCPGPEKCELCMPHPPNMEAVHGRDVSSFCIGCTACFGCTEAQQDVSFNAKNVFGFEDRMWLDFSNAAEVLEMLGEQEVRARLKVMQPELAEDLDKLSAEICADRLLPLAAKAFEEALEAASKAREEAARAREEELQEYARAMERERKLELDSENAKQCQAAENIAFWAKVDRDFVRPEVNWHILREERRSKHACRSLAHQTQLETKVARQQKRRPISKRGHDHLRRRGRRTANDLQGLGINMSAEQSSPSWDDEWITFIPGDFLC